MWPFNNYEKLVASYQEEIKESRERVESVLKANDYLKNEITELRKKIKEYEQHVDLSKKLANLYVKEKDAKGGSLQQHLLAGIGMNCSGHLMTCVCQSCIARRNNALQSANSIANIGINWL